MTPNPTTLTELRKALEECKVHPVCICPECNWTYDIESLDDNFECENNECKNYSGKCIIGWVVKNEALALVDLVIEADKERLNRFEEIYKRASKTVYERILEHRKVCNRWGNEFCLDCFGGGITNFRRSVNEEARKIWGGGE